MTPREPTRIRVLSVDDHPLLREGIATMVNSQPDMELAAHASDGREGLRLFEQHRPDVTLMDLRLPDMSGIEVLTAIRNKTPEARVIMLSTFEGDMEITRAMAAGARGYLLKTMPPREILDVIRQVHAGKKRIPPEVASHLAEHLGEEQLSAREVQVLELIALGRQNKEVGAELFITEETVKVHVRNIMGKLGAGDRTEAVTIAIRRGIIRI